MCVSYDRRVVRIGTLFAEGGEAREAYLLKESESRCGTENVHEMLIEDHLINEPEFFCLLLCCVFEYFILVHTHFRNRIRYKEGKSMSKIDRNRLKFL